MPFPGQEVLCGQGVVVFISPSIEAKDDFKSESLPRDVF